MKERNMEFMHVQNGGYYTTYYKRLQLVTGMECCLQFLILNFHFSKPNITYIYLTSAQSQMLQDTYITKNFTTLYNTYRVIQEESALLWEMIVLVILSKKVHTNMGPILNGYGVMGIF